MTQFPSWELWALLPFWVFLPNLLPVFSEPVIFSEPVSYFSRKCWDFLWVFFSLSLFYFSVPYFGLACDHGNSFLCLEE